MMDLQPRIGFTERDTLKNEQRSVLVPNGTTGCSLERKPEEHEVSAFNSPSGTTSVRLGSTPFVLSGLGFDETLSPRARARGYSLPPLSWLNTCPGGQPVLRINLTTRTA